MNAANASYPEREVTYRMHPAYMARENSGMAKAKIIGREGCWGSRWYHGPLCFERFTGDVEPEVVKDGIWRLMVWQRVHRTDRPKGWMRGFRGMSIGMTGYAPLPQTGDPCALWSTHAKRHLKTWRKSGWIIREIGYDEFMQGYARSNQDVVLRSLFGAVLKSKIASHPGLVRIHGAAPSADARIEAAFAMVDVPETGESLHAFSYLCPAARPVDAGTGLMEHWYAGAQQRGVRWMDFGIFWRKGEPSSWKGYSRFKMQFGTRPVEYSAPLMRFVRG